MGQSFHSDGNNGNGFLLFIDGFTLSVIWNKAHYSLVDSHSRVKNGQVSVDGSSVLLQSRSLIAIEKYVKKVYLTAKNLDNFVLKFST